MEINIFREFTGNLLVIFRHASRVTKFLVNRAFIIIFEISIRLLLVVKQDSMFILFKKNCCLFLFLSWIPFLSFSEGTKELMPDSTVSAADLYITLLGGYSQFGLINCPANYRLYIHVKNPGESILMGFNTLNHNSTYHYNLRKPDGTIVMSGLCPYNTSVTGYIQYYHQAIKGPFPSTGGYTPLAYKVNSIADTGDYYFELFNTNYILDDDIPIWDFQVVSGAHTPALPSDTINGRVWSQSWQFQAQLGTNRTFNARFFVYSDDGIVTKLKFTDARVGALTIFCNPTGCYNTGNFVSDRKSVATNTFITFPGIAQYKVFLNNPDTSVYRSGAFGAITGSPYLIADTAFPPCSAEKKVEVEVNKTGTAEINLSFPYGAPATNVLLQANVTSGINYIPWNGKDGQGNNVPYGTLVNIQLIYRNGLTNLPIWDQETNPAGYKINLVRPANPVSPFPMVFWDDSNISWGDCPDTVNLTGCVPFPTGCHTWSGADCHDKMINTWWYGDSDTAITTAVYYGQITAAEGHDSARCGPGTVLLHATVPSSETVDWYDTVAGGSPLLTGDTSFTTPYINVNTIYYAQARDDSSICLTITRTPVNAFIKPVPDPNLNGPQQVCDSSQGNQYITDSNMTDYTWTVSPGNIITGGYFTNQIFVTWMVPGIQQVSVNYTNLAGCRGAEPTGLSVMVTPRLDTAGPVSGPREICAGTNEVLYFVPPLAYATIYTWTVPAGVLIVSGAGTDSITVNFPQDAQSGNITVFASDSCGDGYPALYRVDVYQPPLAYAGSDDTICQEISFTVTRATASDYKGLLWTTNGQGSLAGDTTLSPTYYPAFGETGPVSLTLIVSGNASCDNDTSRMTLWITGSPVVSAGPDASVCESRSYPITGAIASQYQSVVWTTSGTGHFSDPLSLNPVYFPGGNEITMGYTLLTLHATPVIPCLPVSDSMKLSILRAPVVSAGPGAITCESLPVTLNGASASGYDSLLWSHNGQGTLTGERTLTPTYQPAADDTGSVICTLSAYGKEACFDSIARAQTRIRIFTAVIANAGPDRLCPYGTPDTLSGIVKGGSGSFRFRWEPGSMLSNSTLLNPVTDSLFADTSFIFTVTDDSSGCTATDTVRVRIKKPTIDEFDCLMVHNVITPNGDGVNDTWIIECIEKYPDNWVDIFNEWGDRINYFRHYDNIKQVWDGTNLNKKHVPDGTYYYVLTIKNMNPRTGWILVRGGW
jgi:gliding motility-associated-like protein